MKVCVIQPPYSMRGEDLRFCEEKLFSLLDECDESLDLIVLPEYSDNLANITKQEDFLNAIKKYNGLLMEKARATAKRCNALVFVNGMYDAGNGYRNTTYAFDRNGKEIGKYFKSHPAPSEVRSAEAGGHGLDVAYSYAFESPFVLEIEGLRFGFLTCYDFYFYERFPLLARENLDIIIGCSLQRTDSHDALSIINRFLCYQTNAYLVRASVSLGEDSLRCGCSSVISPFGEELVNMKSKVGLGICEIDPKNKHYKPAGFGGEPKAHYEYMEEGRRPWSYRNGGASVCLFEDTMPYPRVCAHRGFSTIAPENSLPAYGAAVAIGVQEIEFDIWATKDKKLVSCHDEVLERVSTGQGKIGDYTYEELLRFDFGVKWSEKFAGLKIPLFEEILQKFAGRVIMNIHVKLWEVQTPDPMIEEIIRLIRKYDCARHVYLMCCRDEIAREVKAYAPDIPICLGWDGNPEPLSMPKRAIALGVKKIQLFKPYFNAETVKLAHENGILCNLFFSDDPKEANEYLDMGIDTVLTNDCQRVYSAVNAIKKKKYEK